MACGLPIIYKKSGASIELLNGFGLGYDYIEEVPDLIKKIKGSYSYYKNLIMSNKMDSAGREYKKLIDSILKTK